ncbi:MAG: thrombospondin type 3 repeat-containing protein [Myxococcota bacterium]
MQFQTVAHDIANQRPEILATRVEGFVTPPGLDVAAENVRDHRGKGGYWEFQSSKVLEFPVYITKGTIMVYATSNNTPGSDPVLHLLSIDPSTQQATELAYDDNSGTGNNANLVFQAPRNGEYVLVLRAKTAQQAGRCSLHRNGFNWLSNLSFGGFQASLPNLRVAEKVETVPLPNPPSKHILYLLKGPHIAARHPNTASGSAFYTTTQPGTQIALVGTGLLATDGQMRLVRNDVNLSGHDTDADGLGFELEHAVGTCASLTGIARGFECHRATDARDTDGDGLSDGVEFLGKRVRAPYQLLPQWGANARHKDIFVEVDFMIRRKMANGTWEPDIKMPAQVARTVAAIYADKTDSALTPLYAALHAQQLANPDLLPGITLHYDTGRRPETPDDATTYGDWGGHDAVPPQVAKQMPTMMAPTNVLG